MPSIYDIKPAFQKLLRPFSNLLARIGVTPNHITILALILSAITGVLLASDPLNPTILFLVPAMLFVRMILNAIDGMIAREHRLQTSLGTFLNELGDVLSDTVLYLPFCFMPMVFPPLIVTIVILSIISEMSGIIAIQIGKVRRYDGPMGKSDRAFVFGLLAIIIGMGVMPDLWLNFCFTMIIFLLLLTIKNRVYNALREANV